MKRKFLLLSIIGAFFLMSFGASELFYPTGAPPGHTGSPGDGTNCTACHGGTATNSAGWITSDIPPGGYVPGQTYQITATNTLTTSTGKYGFQVSPQNVAGTLMGTLIAGTNNQLVGSNKYVTHTLANLTDNSWTFSWVAPVAGSGSVTFYGAFARGKPGPVTLSTLSVNEALSAPGPAGAIAGPSSVCQGNSESYSIAAVSGATSYTWSVPSGATIVSGQGTTNVSVSFGSFAATGNISVFGSNSAGSGAASNLNVTATALPMVPSVPMGPAMVYFNITPTSMYTTSGSSGALTYQWQILPAGAGTISGSGMSATVTWGIFLGQAEVRVKGINSCGESIYSDAFMVTVDNSTGISDPESVVWNVWYNSSSRSLMLNLENIKGDVKMNISDVSGRRFLSENIQGGQTYSKSTDLNSGIYIVRIQSETQSFSRKIFVK